MAHFAQLVNAIAPIFTKQNGLFLQTIYHPLRLYAEHMQEIALDVHVNGDTYDLPAAQETASVGRVHHVSDLGPFQLLDAVATCDDAGRALTIAIVDHDHARALTATVNLGGAPVSGAAEMWEVNGPDVGVTNSFETPRAVDVASQRVEMGGSRFDYTFPAHSITIVRTAVSR